MAKLILLLSLLMVFVSCGKDGSLWPTQATAVSTKIEPAQSEAYSYQFTGFKCNTDEHSFTTFELACEALKDHELNNDCAEVRREELFLSAGCPGSFS